MRVLQANKFFFAKGGAERYFLDLLDLLPARGHAVAPFSMRHPSNASSPFSEYFVGGVDYGASGGGAQALAAARRTIYNRETARRVRALVRAFRPDVAHLHNVHHQLSGALFEALAAEGVPIVQTLHDFQWVCPVYTFLSHGEICERCAYGRVFPAVHRRCHGGSLARSMVAALELKVGERRGWLGMVSRFLAPSAFLRTKVVEHGLPAAKVATLGYCLRLDAYRPGGERGDHALYAGRLSHEKGVATLLEAAARVPGLRLRVAGGGPASAELERRAEAIAPGRVRFLGHLEPDRLHEELGAAAFVVVPSEWYENQPFAVLEAFAMATPVVGAAIGGIPELVSDGATGTLFTSGSVDSLADALSAMRARSDRDALGANARRWVEERFDPERHLDALLAVYAEVAA
jgi:glycosyltransferase involved in cell wall biosynthesis